jgi:transcription termination factor NusB
LGSSNFGVCITELIDELVNVIHAVEDQRPDFNVMIQTTINLLDKYDIRLDNCCRVRVDDANPSFIRALQDIIVDEASEYNKQISLYKKNYPSVYDLQSLQQDIFVIPVAF